MKKPKRTVLKPSNKGQKASWNWSNKPRCRKRNFQRREDAIGRRLSKGREGTKDLRK